eukprot:scpid71300/ scgid28968/ 
MAAISHPVQVTIENNSGFSMNFDGDYYVHGKVEDDAEWPRLIDCGGKIAVLSFGTDQPTEDGSCAGYVSYSMGPGTLTIAFTCDDKENKVAAGTNPAMSIFHSQSSFKYQPYTQPFKFGDQTVEVTISCTKGQANLVKATLRKL